MIDNKLLIALDSLMADHKISIKGKEYLTDLSLSVLLQTHIKQLRRKVQVNLSRFTEDFIIFHSED